MKKFFAVISLIIASVHNVAADTVIFNRWVDARGHVHYSTHPRECSSVAAVGLLEQCRPVTVDSMVHARIAQTEYARQQELRAREAERRSERCRLLEADIDSANAAIEADTQRAIAGPRSAIHDINEANEARHQNIMRLETDRDECFPPAMAVARQRTRALAEQRLKAAKIEQINEEQRNSATSAAIARGIVTGIHRAAAILP